MSEYYEFRFKINDLTLDTISMRRVLEYLSDVATLIGRTDDVHLLRIESGSIDTVFRTDRKETAEKIESRVRDASRGIDNLGRRNPAVDTEVRRAFRALTKRLGEDRTTGVFMHEAGAEIIRLHGDIAPKNAFGPFNQEGSLDGVVVRLGGVNDPVPVHLESDSESYQCLASRAVARELAKHIFETPLRVYGVGRWLRNEDGQWTLENFTIRDFHPLNDESLISVIAKLRAVPGNEWGSIENPLAELDRMRNGDDDDESKDD